MYPKVDISNIDRVVEKARRQKKSIPRAAKKAMRGTAQRIQELTEDLFDSSEQVGLFFGGDRGVEWVDRVGEEEYRWPKLIKTGALRKSIRYRTRIRRIGRSRWQAYAQIYSDPSKVHYGWRHQFGDEENNVPARPFLFVNEEERDDIIREFGVELFHEGFLHF